MNEVRPYIDASAAAALLCVDRAAVVADVQAGMDGAIASLVGTLTKGGVVVVAPWELESPRLEMHRARLAVGDTAVLP